VICLMAGYWAGVVSGCVASRKAVCCPPCFVWAGATRRVLRDVVITILEIRSSLNHPCRDLRAHGVSTCSSGSAG
jgi:hypothetical protein